MNHILKLNLLFSSLFLLCLPAANAQVTECYELEQLSPTLLTGQIHGSTPGDTIGTDIDMIVTVENYIDFDGSINFRQASIDTASNHPNFIHAQRRTLRTEHINTKFDFSRTLNNVFVLQGYAYQYAEGINFSVNNNPTQYYTNFNSIPNNYSANIQFYVEEAIPNSGSSVEKAIAFTIISQTRIENFTLGGADLVLDNFCYSSTQDAICRVYNLMNVPECDADQVAKMTFFGSHTLDNILEVEVTGNGNNYGIYNLENGVPFSIDDFGSYAPFPKVLEFNFTDLGGRCSWKTKVSEPICKPNNDTCTISNIDFQANFCDINGDFWADLDFDSQNQNDSFDLKISTGSHALDLGLFAYTDLPLSIGPFSDTLLGLDKNYLNWQLKITDSQDTNCAEGLSVFDSVYCQRICVYEDLELTDIFCQKNPDTGAFDSIGLSLNFDTTGTFADSFGLIIANQLVGYFDYDDLPLDSILVENTGGKQKAITVFEYSSLDPTSFDCQTTEYFKTPCLDCAEDLIVEVLSIPNLDGDYLISIDLSPPAIGDRFELSFDGTVIDSFAYSDLPLIEEVNCTAFSDSVVVSVRGLDTLNCQVEGYYKIDCLNCQTPDYQAVASNCTGSNYDLAIDFNTGTGTPQDVEIFVNDISVGIRNSANNLRFTNLPAQSTRDLNIKICELGNNDCCIEKTIPNPCFNFCEIEIVNAVATACDDDGMFSIELDVTADNRNGTNFVIFVNGDLQTTAGYQPGVQSFVLGPFDGTTQDPFEIVIFDVLITNCRAEFNLDSPNCNPNPCNISDIQAEVTTCDGDNFSLNIFFNSQNVSSDSFDLTIDNQFVGSYKYADLPLDLDNLPGSTDDKINILICDKSNAACCQDIEIDYPCGDCSIDNFRATGIDCTVDQEFYFLLNGNINTRQSNDSFEIKVDGNIVAVIGNADFLMLSNIGIAVGPFDGSGGNIFDISIQSRALNGCIAEITSDFTCPLPPCELRNLILETQPCDDQQEYLLDIDFVVDNPASDSFLLTRNGVQIGKFAYANLPITVGSFFGNGATDSYVVTDSDDFDCRVEGSLLSPDCPAPACEIDDLIVSPRACDADGNFEVAIDFNFRNNVSNFFELYVNDVFVNSYRFSQLPIVAGSFSGDGIDYDFEVKDAGNQDCTAEFNLPSPNCPQPSCEITNLNIGTFACDNNDDFSVEVNFDYQNNVSSNFELLVNGNFFASYPYSSLPIMVTSLVGNGSTYTFAVRDSDDFNCTADVSFISPDCTSDNCEITNFSATAGNCDNDANFETTIDFDIRNNASDSFDLQINGSYSATYAYANLPISAGTFPANGNILSFAATDQLDGNCSESTALTSPTCSPVPCVLSDFLAEAGTCDANEQFMVDIDFNYAAASDSFSLFVNNSFYDNYAYSDLFITVGPFDGNGSTLDFEVIDLDDANCTLAGSLMSPDCAPCELTDISTTTTDCDLNGSFFYEINFNVANASDSFRVNLLGNPYNEIFAYTDLPVMLGPLDGNGSSVYAFNVSDQAEPNCNLNFSALAPNCNCSIRDINTEISDCDSDTNYFVDLDFIYENTSDSFTVNGQGLLQNFAYVDLPIILGPFAGNGQTTNYLITDLVRTGCSENFTISAPICTIPCALSNPSVDAEPCDNQGNFMATIDFDHSNTTSPFFNTNGYGIYAYADLPVSIGPFVGDGTTDYNLNITDGNDADCNLPMIVPAQFCGDSCRIYNLQATASDCDGMGSFELFLEFDSDNTNGAGFVVTVNGQAIGPLPYSTPQPISLGNFFGDGQTSYSIFVLDAGDALCNASTTFAPVNCLPCELTNITATTTPCDGDGNFSVIVDFTDQNGSPAGFSITGNGTNYGTFSYSDLPIPLGVFAGDGTSVYEFVVTDMEDPTCTISTTVGPINCNTNNCRIFDVNAQPTDCNSDGEFSVDIRFNYEDIGNSGFTVRGNGMVYGVYNYDQLPIRIDNLIGDGNTVYEFVIIDNDDSNCNNFTTVGPIDCDDTNCSITDLDVEILDCNGNGTYQVAINFAYSNPTNTTFDVFTTRGLFGTYDLTQLPLIITNFPSNGNPFDAVRVCINDNRNCCASTFFPTPDCDGDCIEFEVLPYDTAFIDSVNMMVFDTILIENSVVMTSNVFLSANGPVLDSITADSANQFFDAAIGIQLTTHNATIDFKFPNFTGFPCREVTFNYYQGGDLNNISINGEPVKVFNRFEDLPFNIGTAVIAEVFPTNSREGVLKLKGFINTIRLGGDNLSFDNICYGECLNFVSVWPGDINLDNWVSHYDILNFGIAYDAQGPDRADQTTDWEELPADDWLRYFGRGQNYKHSDCNGDGLVDERDLDVIEENYGEFHDMILPLQVEPPPPNSPPLFIEFPDPSEVSVGVPFTAKLILSEEINPVFNLYGFAFNLRYDKDKVRIINVQYPPGWFGEPGEDVLTIDETFPDVGLTHVGMTRINKENVTGSGQVAEFIIILDDIVQRGGTVDLELDGIVGISKEEFPVPLGGTINQFKTASDVIDLPEGTLSVFPNPTEDIVYFNLNSTQKLDFVEVTSADGKVLDTFRPKANHLTLNHYTPGMYVLKFVIDGQPYYDRIIKQ